jgi:hypothetical protein
VTAMGWQSYLKRRRRHSREIYLTGSYHITTAIQPMESDLADAGSTWICMDDHIRKVQRDISFWYRYLEVPEKVQVPRLAETILTYLYSPEKLEGMLGDLEEGFRRITTRQGLNAARWWYRWQTARSVVASVGNFLLRVASIVEAIRKLCL